MDGIASELGRRGCRIGFLAAAFVLAGCVPLPIPIPITNPGPDIVPYLPEGFRSSAVEVLVLPVSCSRISDSCSLDRPVFLEEKELDNLSSQLVRGGVGIPFVPLCLLCGGGIARFEQKVTEVCVIWPDGRILDLAGRLLLGTATAAWRSRFLELVGSVPKPAPLALGVCPAAEVAVDWTEAERRRVFEFIKRIGVIDDSLNMIVEASPDLRSTLAEERLSGDSEVLVLSITNPASAGLRVDEPRFLRARDLSGAWLKPLARPTPGVGVVNPRVSFDTLSEVCVIYADGYLVQFITNYRGGWIKRAQGFAVRPWRDAIARDLADSAVLPDYYSLPGDNRMCLVGHRGASITWTSDQRAQAVGFLKKIPVE